MERKETLIAARSASSSCVNESAVRSSRMRRPSCVTRVAALARMASVVVPRKLASKTFTDVRKRVVVNRRFNDQDREWRGEKRTDCQEDATEHDDSSVHAAGRSVNRSRSEEF